MASRSRGGAPRKVVKLALVTTVSAILAVVSMYSRHLHHTSQAIFAVIYTIGVLVTSSYGSATFISLVAGGLYSLTSQLGFLIIFSWLVRGLTVDLLLRIMNVFNASAPSPLRVSGAMTISSLATGLSHYLVIIKFLRLIPDPPLVLVIYSILIAVISTSIASYFTTKYLYRRIRTVLPW